MLNSRATRFIFLVMGLFFVGLGIVGIFLPILPTTPFMIIALGCFARGSQTLHDWLYNHRLFGPSLQTWDEHRVIPPIAKIFAVAAMGISFFFMVTMTEAPFVSIMCAAVTIAYGAWYVLSKPSIPPTGKNRDK